MKKNKFILNIIAAFVGFIFLFPFLWGVMLSFKDNNGIFGFPMQLPDKIDLSLYVTTFNKAHILLLYKNSLLLSIVETFIGLLLLYFSSFAIGRLYHKYAKMGDFFYYLFLAANAVPLMVLLMTFYLITMTTGKLTGGILGLDSIWGLILPYMAGGIPFTTLMMVGAMKGIPLEMEEAAVVEGCSLIRTMFSIDLPLMKPMMITLAIFSFLGVWNEFPIASILLSSRQNYTIPLAMAFFKDQFSADYGAILRGVIIIMIPQLVFFIVFQRRIIEGMVTAGLKG